MDSSLYTWCSRIVLAILLSSAVIKEVSSQARECNTPENRRGSCVNVDDCPQIADILRNAPKPLPAGVQDYIRRLACGTVNGRPGLCCTQPSTTTFNIQTPSPVGTTPTRVPVVPAGNPNTNTNTGTNANSKIEVPNHRNINLLPTQGCGPISTDKLAGGEKAGLGEFPWMALLRYRTPENDLRFMCGASIISSRYILTAAHCVTKLPTGYNLHSVVVGEQNIDSDPDCEDGVCNDQRQEVFFEDIISHESYDRPRFSNDIALIRVTVDITFLTDFVKPVCLPTTPELLNRNVTNLIVSGWGTTEEQRPSTDLLKARLSVVPISDCQTAHRLNQLNEDQICAKGKGIVDTCKGDSGGPLVFPVSRYVQFGVVSAGARGCGVLADSKPGIYVKVQNYMKWILDNIRN